MSKIFFSLLYSLFCCCCCSSVGLTVYLSVIHFLSFSFCHSFQCCFDIIQIFKVLSQFCRLNYCLVTSQVVLCCLLYLLFRVIVLFFYCEFLTFVFANRLARGRDEWESAALQNANTKCNGLLPIWGPQVIHPTESDDQ